MSADGESGYAIQSGEGRSFWWTADILRVEKVETSRTDGRSAVSEVTVNAHYSAPPHVHHREDKAVYVLEGSLTVYLSPNLVERGRSSSCLARFPTVGSSAMFRRVCW